MATKGEQPVKSMLSTASAVALSFALLAGVPAGAQEQTADAVMNEMSELGMDVEGMVLTEEQVLQIQAILGEGSEEDTTKVDRINELLGTN